MLDVTLSLNVCLNAAPYRYSMWVEVKLCILFSFPLDCGERIVSRCGRYIPEETAAEYNCL